MPVNCEVRDLGADDISDVVALHLNAFPGFLMSLLGREFLCEYYSAALDDQNRIMCGYFDSSGALLGFSVGSTNPTTFYLGLRRRSPRLAWALLRGSSLGTTLRLGARFARAVLRALRGQEGHAPPHGYSELASIAVISHARGQRVGFALLGNFIDQSFRSGCRGTYLTTDRDNNDSVNTFYMRNGFKIVREVYRGGGRYLNFLVNRYDN